MKLKSSELIICNTTPLLYLIQMDLLSIIQNVCGRIVVPKAVIEELKIGGEQGALSQIYYCITGLRSRSPLQLQPFHSSRIWAEVRQKYYCSL